MTPRVSIIGRLAELRSPRSVWTRRTILAFLIAICAVFTFFPERYRAVVSLSPTDPSSLGLSSTLGQLGSSGSLFGNQAAIEISLKIARSLYVRQIVAKRTNLADRLEMTSIETDRWLKKHVVIRSLRGGILQFELLDSDPEFGVMVVGAFAEAVREQLGIVARKQIDTKRQILVDLVDQSSDRLSRAQAAFDTFRLRTRYSDPENAIAAIGTRVPLIEGEIRSKEIELAAASAFVTENNMRSKRVVAEINVLKQQLAEARSTSPINQDSVGRVVQESTQAERLRRELNIALGLYESYKRFLQGTTVEDLTSTANVRILEPAFVDSDRQMNLLPLAIGLLLLLLALAIEFYTLRPPVGHRMPA